MGDVKCCSQEDSSTSTTTERTVLTEELEATTPPIVDGWAGLCVEPGLHNRSYITARQLLECKRRLSELVEDVNVDDSKRVCQAAPAGKSS
jgi:hypothetical protein